MPRIPGKGKKLAYKLLGTPPNIAFKRNKMQQEVNKRLAFEESSRSR
jgi:hypothetical protein